jgi:hypothetical protein
MEDEKLLEQLRILFIILGLKVPPNVKNKRQIK